MSSPGKSLRLYRILDRETRKGVIVAFDHGLMLGPIPGMSPDFLALPRSTPVEAGPMPS